MKESPTWNQESLGAIDSILKPCESLVPFPVLFTIRWNLLALVYDKRAEAVRAFNQRILAGRIKP